MCIVTCLSITRLRGLNMKARFLWVSCKYTFVDMCTYMYAHAYVCTYRKHTNMPSIRF